MKTINEIKNKFLTKYMASSQKTYGRYERELNMLFEVCNIHNDLDLQNFNEDNLANFYNYAKNHKWANSTINLRLTTLKCFFKWCNKKGLTNISYEDIKLSKNDNHVLFTPSREDCDAFLLYIKNHTKKKRLYLMTNLLLNSGLRRFEICNLKIEDIDLQNSCLNIKGKGNKLISQPIKTSLINELLEYINNERKDIMLEYTKIGGKDLGYLFVSSIGENCRKDKNLYDGNKIKENSFYQQIKRYAKISCVENFDLWDVHALRRRYVTSIYENTGDILIAQKAARHSNSSTTVRCYIDFNKNRLIDAVNSL